VQEVVDRALSLVQEQLRLRQISVTLDFLPESPVVLGNAIQLEQVFINLLTNARDALEASERKEVHIACSVGEDVVIVFRDTGPGIPDGLEQRIFDPFFTTKDVGSGTGLGLSITYGIVGEHDGEITVENRPGEGAAFRIALPLAYAARGDGD
jgi:signal transduction histidine kinase